MAVKYVAVIVDDFTWRSYDFSNVTIYDYATWDSVSYYDSYYYDWFNNYDPVLGNPYSYAYDLGDVDSTINNGVVSYDWVNVQRYAEAPTLVDYATTGPYWNGYSSYYGAYQYEEYVYQENYIELNPVSPSLDTTPMHGDWVLNAFFSQLDDPNCVEVICIDTDAGNSS